VRDPPDVRLVVQHRLVEVLFADAELDEIKPDPADVAGFDAFMERYVQALPILQAARRSAGLLIRQTRSVATGSGGLRGCLS